MAARSPTLERAIDELRHELGVSKVRTSGADVSLYDRDASTFHGDGEVVCFPESRDDVITIIRRCHERGIPFVARGSGTGLTGGAVPVDGAVVIVMTKMQRVLSVDPVHRMAWVEPGVLNLDLSRAATRYGLHFAPDPSSQQSCTIGGNVANNSGGPQCLAEGVTSAHIHAVEVVLPDASVVVLGGEDPEPEGYDLRGAFIGSEGMFGIATAICVRLTPNPPAVSTVLADFVDVRSGADAVSAIIAAGVVPAALEMMDSMCIRAVEAFVGIGLPQDAGALLLVEIDGASAAVEAHMARVQNILSDHGARHLRVAADDIERGLLWKARKSAFGAVARLRPHYYLHDTVVPRRQLTQVLTQIYEIAARYELDIMNVFHAGDGNLHPILMFDRRWPGVMDRVHAAGAEIVAVSVGAGGSLSGEHGVGVEKRELMPLMFGPDDLEAQCLLRRVFDPLELANPGKVLPTGSRCGDLGYQPEGTWI